MGWWGCSPVYNFAVELIQIEANHIDVRHRRSEYVVRRCPCVLKTGDFVYGCFESSEDGKHRSANREKREWIHAGRARGSKKCKRIGEVASSQTGIIGGDVCVVEGM